MSIERSQAPQFLQAGEPQPNKKRNSADAEKTPESFAALMQAQAAPKPAERPKSVDKPNPSPSADAVAQTRRAENQGKTENQAKAAKADGDDEEENADEAGNEDDTVGAQQAAAAALALAATGVLVPVAAKLGPATKDLVDKAVGVVDGFVDANSNGAVKGGAARTAPDAARAALGDSRPVTGSLAGYASVLEQLQNRLSRGEKGDSSLHLDVALPAIDAGATAAKAGASLAQQNARMDKLMNALQTGIGQVDDTAKAALASLSAGGGEALKAIERLRGDTTRDSRGATPDGTFGQQNFASTVQFDGTAVSAMLPGAATAEAVADQVGYWVAQGVQNAEITLDGPNAERVEVKISMSGNEAHVEFRSDQPATREMLAGTAGQLKDLLGSQGVVLSGVTVGQAGADLAGGQQQQSRPREGRGQGRGSVDEGRALAPITAAAVPSTSAPAGTLDLFV